jgi:ABC-type Na+ efflux pump permease subunit
MPDENEILAQEIYEYYQNKSNSNDTADSDKKDIADTADAEKSQKDNVKNLLPEALKNIFWDRKKLLVLSVVLAALLAVLCGYVIGLAIPKSSERISEIVEQMKNDDDDYQKALSSNDKLTRDVDNLYDEKAQRKAELENITDYEETRDMAKDELDELTAQLEDVQKEVALKSDELEQLDNKIKASGGSEITLSPGMYTVGKQIPAGEYSVIGNGSLLVSDSQSNLKINTKLTSSAYTCQLSNGDTIKLETQAKLNPAE